MTIFFDRVVDVLKQDSRFFTEDGVLLKNAVYEAAMQMDSSLIKLLLTDEEIKSRFFVDVDGTLVFDKVAFGWIVSNKEFFPDSFTRFKNKIGLTDSQGRYISNTNDVTLSFPYKDCILEGGQTKEDQKRTEVFYNETLAPDEVDRLLAPKVLSSAKRYDSTGEHTKVTFNDDNLVIQGNNLLSLNCLKKYEGRIKCIYIDVPYNTGNDGFGYNDRFNHSTWLTFMQNRLKIAHKLLSKDGTIAISVDNYELAYLMVLLDEIFGKENRKNVITVRRASASGAKVINPGVVNIVEYVVLYSRNTKFWKPNRVFAAKGYDDRYNSYIENIDDDYSRWKFSTVLEAFAKAVGIQKSKLKSHFGDNYNIELENFVVSNAEKIVRLAALDDKQISSETRELKKQSIKNPNVIIHQHREGYKDYYLLNGNAILFAKDRLIEVDGYKSFSAPLTDIWDDVLPNDLHNEGGVELKKGKKPEKLIARILELCTNENDIVLDFFAGSGTTGAVAMKMNRKFIICEQMEYGENSPTMRLINTIQGDKRGVSSMYNWHGGGSFVYCELKKLNQTYVDKIRDASDEDTLSKLYDEIISTGFISYKVNPNELFENSDGFNSLSIDEKKMFLIELLDKNLLYVNYCDIDDKEYCINEDDKSFSSSFYKEG